MKPILLTGVKYDSLTAELIFGSTTNICTLNFFSGCSEVTTTYQWKVAAINAGVFLP
jgi:hypothetical protein